MACHVWFCEVSWALTLWALYLRLGVGGRNIKLVEQGPSMAPFQIAFDMTTGMSGKAPRVSRKLAGQTLKGLCPRGQIG